MTSRTGYKSTGARLVARTGAGGVGERGEVMTDEFEKAGDWGRGRRRGSLAMAMSNADSDY